MTHFNVIFPAWIMDQESYFSRVCWFIRHIELSASKQCCALSTLKCSFTCTVCLKYKPTKPDRVTRQQKSVDTITLFNLPLLKRHYCNLDSLDWSAAFVYILFMKLTRFGKYIWDDYENGFLWNIVHCINVFLMYLILMVFCQFLKSFLCCI